jgi:hypothetical protein
MKLLLLIECEKGQFSKLETVLKMIEMRLKQEEDEVWLESNQILPSSFSVENTDSISVIWKQAHNFVEMINGAAKLEMKNWLPAKLKNMQWEDDFGNRKWLPISASVRIFDTHAKVKGYVQMQNSAESMTSSQDRTQVEVEEYHPSALYLAAAGCNESAAKALRLVNRKMDWINLYRILEVISEDVGGYKAIEIRGWANTDKINTFTGSANNSSVSGDDSRHGKIQSGQPKQTMDLREARDFMGQLLRKWLKSKGRKAI